LNCTRQWGKSTISAAKAVHQAATIPGSLTIVISPAARQSGEFVRKASRLVEYLGKPPDVITDREFDVQRLINGLSSR